MVNLKPFWSRADIQISVQDASLDHSSSISSSTHYITRK